MSEMVNWITIPAGTVVLIDGERVLLTQNYTAYLPNAVLISPT